MYQLPDLPSLNTKFPSNATFLLILCLIGLNVFYLFYHLTLSIPMLFAFADRAGLLFVVNLPLLYLLSAKNQPLRWLIGASYESLNIFHRRLGEIMITLAFLHTAGMLGVWYTLLRYLGFSLSRFLMGRVVLLGIFTFLAYETIYFTSLTRIRQAWYEWFLGLHILLQVAALVLLWFHHHNSRIYVAIALGIWAVDRLLLRAAVRISRMKARLRVLDDMKTVEVLAEGGHFEGGGRLNRLLRYDLSYGWNPTDHVFLTIPSLSRKHIIQAHPFTIASRAPSPDSPAAPLRLLIRAQDGFSGDLLRYAKNNDSTVIRVDGPYGSQSPVRLLRDSSLAIVVAGGSGIAVGVPLVWSLVIESPDPETARRLDLSQRVLLVWVFHDQNHRSWVNQAVFDQLSGYGVDFMPCLGRRDMDTIMRDWIKKREHSVTGVTRPTVGVVVSGPDGMNREVRNACAKMAREGMNISVDVEKYGW